MGGIESPAKPDLSRLRLQPHEKRAKGSGWLLALVAAGLVLLVLVVVGVALFASHASDNRDSESGAGARNQPVPPRRQPSSGASSSNAAVLAGGYVEARRTAKLMPGRDGVIARVLVTLGQQVSPGDILLELDGEAIGAEREMAAAELELARFRLQGVRAGSRVEEVQAARSEGDAAEADWQDAREELQRLESLAPLGAATAAQVERARHRATASEARVAASRARERLLKRGSRRTDVSAAEASVERATAALRRAEAMLELCRLRAPFDGTVVGIDVEPGEAISLQGGRPVIELADLSEIWVRVDVPETRIARVQLGARAEVVIDALGEERLEATVVEIAPVADRQSNTVSVAVRLDAPPQQLRPNMSARVSIAAATVE